MHPCNAVARGSDRTRASDSASPDGGQRVGDALDRGYTKDDCAQAMRRAARAAARLGIYQSGNPGC